MKTKIIAIEGICCSGKSTLISRLSADPIFGVIGEYGDFSDTFPPDTNTLADLIRNTNFFVELESERFDIFAQLSGEKNVFY